MPICEGVMPLRANLKIWSETSSGVAYRYVREPISLKHSQLRGRWSRTQGFVVVVIIVPAAHALELSSLQRVLYS